MGQIYTPSGKAIVQYTPPHDMVLDFYICSFNFGQTHLPHRPGVANARQRIGTTISVYENMTFVWYATVIVMLLAHEQDHAQP